MKTVDQVIEINNFNKTFIQKPIGWKKLNTGNKLINWANGLLDRKLEGLPKNKKVDITK